MKSNTGCPKMLTEINMSKYTLYLNSVLKVWLRTDFEHYIEFFRFYKQRVYNFISVCSKNVYDITNGSRKKDLSKTDSAVQSYETE